MTWVILAAVALVIVGVVAHRKRAAIVQAVTMQAAKAAERFPVKPYKGDRYYVEKTCWEFDGSAWRLF